MIKVNENISIPSCWNDLSPKQVVETIRITLDYLKSKMNLYEYRFSLLKLYTGYKRSQKRYTVEEQEQINSNLFVLADMIKFPIKPKYKNSEYLEICTKELQCKLKTLFPFEISEPDELEQLELVIKELDYYPILNLDLHKNPIPTINTETGTLTGVTFNIDKHCDVETDLSTNVYCEAYAYYRNFIDLSNTKYLNTMVAILYRPTGEVFNLFKAQQRAKKQIKNIPHHEKMTVFYWFQSLMEWVASHPIYGILYTQSDDANDSKISLGMSETVYSLSKEGYGTTAELNNELVTEFWNKQVKRLRDMVNELRGADIKPAKICEKLGLSIETLKLL